MYCYPFKSHTPFTHTFGRRWWVCVRVILYCLRFRVTLPFVECLCAFRSTKMWIRTIVLNNVVFVIYRISCQILTFLCSVRMIHIHKTVWSAHKNNITDSQAVDLLGTFYLIAWDWTLVDRALWQFFDILYIPV